MATNSLTDCALVIEEQLAAQEKLSEHLCKVEALACVTASDDFLDYKPSIIHAYLWALEDLITDAQKLNQQAIEALLKDSRGLGYR